MKILLVSSSSGSRGGGELYLLYLARALKELGHEPALWTSRHLRMDELCHLFRTIGDVHRSEYTNLYDRNFRTLSSYFDRQTPERLTREWARIPHDLLHINKQNLEDGFELMRAAQLLRRPSVCTIHLTQSARYLGAKGHWIRDYLSRAFLRGYDGHFITVLEERAQDLRKFLGRDRRITAIPNGVPVPTTAQLQSQRAEIRESLGLTAADLLIVAVGRLVPQKRPLVFLEVARKIAARLPGARFLWVGDGTLGPEFDANARDLPGVSRLTWQQDVGPYLAAADVFLHVAQYEGLPLAVLEAMAAGLPCLVTPNLKNELLFLDASNSLVAHEEDQEWMAVLEDRTRLKEMGKAARRTIEGGYSFLIMARACLRIYESKLEAS